VLVWAVPAVSVALAARVVSELAAQEALEPPVLAALALLVPLPATAPH
jgi:hypothetical protein